MAKKKALKAGAPHPPSKQTTAANGGNGSSPPPSTLERDAATGGASRLAGSSVDRLLRVLLPLVALTAFPFVLSRHLWTEVWSGVRPRAWDGTGHYAIAQIYSQSIFPETFGWTHAYFSGMPFPNFYPPLYYWLIALLHGSHLFSFDAAFKLVTFVPVLLVPASVWLLCRALTDKSRPAAASAAALGGVALLLDERLLSPLPAGLDYFSTFQIGLYTQPLGFVLMAAWYTLYSDARQTPLRIVLSALLLALTALANFFGAATAAVFVLTTVIVDAVRSWRATDSAGGRAERRTLIGHAVSPTLAFCLTLFWVVPVLGQYGYFVTKPYVIEANQLVTPYLLVWYALAAVGFVLWLRRPTRAAWPYTAACGVLAAAAAFATVLAPGWFPLQAPRFLTTLNLLLAVPVGLTLAAGFRVLASLLGETGGRAGTLSLGRARYATALALVLLLVFVLAAPTPRWGNARAFYKENEGSELDAILHFADEHRDGRYLVEVINPTLTPAYADASFDARALNTYLGAQGNETLSTVFHEASPNALFTLPAVNALSSYPDSFGISSALADDLDFAAQPLAKHVERAKLLGVKYVVTRTPAMKERLAGEPSIAARHEFGWWSVLELKGEPAARAQALAYRPALVVSPLALKLRRSNEWSFTRLAEEQFADGWFDVLLARSNERKLDRLRDLDRFGAVIVDDYVYDDEARAYEVLKRFAQERPLILLSDDSALFERVRSSRAEFPKLTIVERNETDRGEPMEALQPTRHYQDNPVRRGWGAVRDALDKGKTAVAEVGAVASETESNKITLRAQPAAPGALTPVLLSNTYHPNWKRDDGETTYAATPFHTLTFAGGPVTLTYGRAPYETAAAWFSSVVLALLLMWLGWAFLRRRRPDADKT